MFGSSNVTIRVVDMDRSIKFYTEILGLGLKNRYGSEWAEIEGPGITIALHPATGKNYVSNPNISIGFGVKNIHEVTKILEKKGVKFQLKDDGFVLLAFFMDPDGAQLYLA